MVVFDVYTSADHKITIKVRDLLKGLTHAVYAYVYRHTGCGVASHKEQSASLKYLTLTKFRSLCMLRMYHKSCIFVV